MRKIYLFFTLGLLTISLGYAQDPYLQNSAGTQEEIAAELTRAYQDDLGMTVEQAAKFRIKAEEYLIRQAEIKERDFPAGAKLALLKELSRSETAEMRNILTLPQYRAYKRLKKDLQPVQVTIKEPQ